MILALIAAVLRDLLSRRIQDISDLQSIAQNATVVGVIQKDEVLDGTKPIVVTKPDGPIAEEFRRIRTNLSFTTSKDGDKGRLIVVTSSMPSEGKTTISSNLAATLAESGSAVLLIDAYQRLDATREYQYRRPPANVNDAPGQQVCPRTPRQPSPETMRCPQGGVFPPHCLLRHYAQPKSA